MNVEMDFMLVRALRQGGVKESGLQWDQHGMGQRNKGCFRLGDVAMFQIPLDF